MRQRFVIFLGVVLLGFGIVACSLWPKPLTAAESRQIAEMAMRQVVVRDVEGTNKATLTSFKSALASGALIAATPASASDWREFAACQDRFVESALKQVKPVDPGGRSLPPARLDQYVQTKTDILQILTMPDGRRFGLSAAPNAETGRAMLFRVDACEFIDVFFYSRLIELTWATKVKDAANPKAETSSAEFVHTPSPFPFVLLADPKTDFIFAYRAEFPARIRITQKCEGLRASRLDMYYPEPKPLSVICPGSPFQWVAEATFEEAYKYAVGPRRTPLEIVHDHRARCIAPAPDGTCSYYVRSANLVRLIKADETYELPYQPADLVYAGS
jgi:hypothetical protein